MGRPLTDIAGNRYGRFVVVRRVVNRPGSVALRWECRCDCGEVREVVAGNLKNGTSQSCGCLSIELRKARYTVHGMKKTPEYRAWSQARARCRDTNHFAYKWYGSRGIAVCERWDTSFVAFYEDMGPRPTPSHTLDRIDTNGPYSPDNCRWASWTEQQNNKRDNRRLTLNGQTMTMAQWEQRLGLKQGRLCARLGHGWSIERALTEPARKRRTSKP